MGISCKQAVDFISKKEEGKLTFRQRTQLLSHLVICSFCRAFDKQNRLLSSIYRKRPVSIETTLKAEEKAAIVKAVEDAPEI